MPQLTLEALLQIPVFELRAKILAEGLLSGAHRAKKYGGGAEFVEHRIYSPGDPVRDIDWKVFGRFDKFYVRKREEEHTLVVNLLVDASRSMDFGEKKQNKLSFAVHLAAGLAYFFHQGRHELGLLRLQGEGPERLIPPKGGPSHFSRILQTLEETTPKAEIDFLRDLQEIAEQRRPAMVFVLSDLLSFDEEGRPSALGPLRLLRARGHDVILFHIASPEEILFPYQGFCEFEDLETSEKSLLDAGGVREAYQREVRSFIEEVERGCQGAGVEYHQARTDQPLDKILVQFFQGRSGT